MGRFHAVPDTRMLLELYARPWRAGEIDGPGWSAILGAARRARAIGHLHHRLFEADVLDRVDARVLAHFDSARVAIRRRRQALVWELTELARSLAAVECPVILLKGAAYAVEGNPLADARVASDVDLLVSLADLERIEHRLRTDGWRSVELNDYDERYYREWSHEIPALCHPARGVEVDVHHSISPHLKAGHPAVMRLFDDSLPVRWSARTGGIPIDRFRVLSPVDQLVHVAVHTFQGSELAWRLREVMDFDVLFRAWLARRGTDGHSVLADRAIELGQARSLYWMLRFSSRWLATPVDEGVLVRLDKPSAFSVSALAWLADRAMLPGNREWRAGTEFASELALMLRYQWQRLPPHRLVVHVLEKARRRLIAR